MRARGHGGGAGEGMVGVQVQLAEEFFRVADTASDGFLEFREVRCTPLVQAYSSSILEPLRPPLTIPTPLTLHARHKR